MTEVGLSCAEGCTGEGPTAFAAPGKEDGVGVGASFGVGAGVGADVGASFGIWARVYILHYSSEETWKYEDEDFLAKLSNLITTICYWGKISFLKRNADHYSEKRDLKGK